jgi:hypothetical protein
MRMKPNVKTRRAQREKTKRAMRVPVVKLYVAVCLMVEDAIVHSWIRRSRGLPDFLRLLADEHFGARETVSLWERGICQVITDLAEREMTHREDADCPFFTPREIVLWFASWCERTFPTSELQWDSKLFAEKNVRAVMAELRKMEEQKHRRSGIFDNTFTLRS